jgi:riboflavin synthase
VCEQLEEVDGSRYYLFRYKVAQGMARKGYVTVEKGSVTVNGVSLTVCDSESDSFRVAIIPYTFEHTNFKHITPGVKVNIEFDIIGKYLSRLMEFAK